jgi:arylsulfatase A-like enzyme
MRDRDRLLGGLCLAWLVAAVAEVGLMILVPTSAVHDAYLTPMERLSLVGVDLTALALAIAVVGVLDGLVSESRRLRSRAARWTLAVAKVVPVLLAWGVAFLGAVSWGLFWSMGTFLDRSAIAFWLAQPLQMFHWAPTELMLGIPPATVLMTVLLWRGGRTLTTRMSTAMVRAVCATALVVLMSLAGMAVAGIPRGDRVESVFRDETSGLAYTVAGRYGQARRSGTGAFAHALFDAADAIAGDGLPQGPRADVEVTRRPLVSMDAYLRTVDASRLQRPNVVLIVVESMRADILRAYGQSRDIMPGIDALSREARVFRRAYTQAGITSDALPCILSSNYSLRSLRQYVFAKAIDHPRVLLYDVLKAAGYRIGFFSSSNEQWGGLINYWNTGSIDALFHPGMGSLPAAKSFDDGLTVSEALKWVDGDRRPFFLYLNMQTSHFPYTVPDHYQRRFVREKPDFVMTLGNFPRDRTEQVRDLYADSLGYVDQQLGRLITHLRARGVWDNTVVVFTGDHGQGFYEHGLVGHGNSLFEEVVRVPLLIRSPGLEPAVVDGLAQHVDVAPSVLDLVGLPPHPAFQGVSLLAPARADARVYLMNRTPVAHMYGLVQGTYKLLYDATHARVLLYDLLADPGEAHDLSFDRADVRARLTSLLSAWIGIQLDYYSSPLLRRTTYPPVPG